MTPTTRSPFVSDTVEPRCVGGPSAHHAYRRFGNTSEPPVVMCTRKRARAELARPPGRARDVDQRRFDVTQIRLSGERGRAPLSVFRHEHGLVDADHLGAHRTADPPLHQVGSGPRVRVGIRN